MRTSIVIRTYNEAEFIGETLREIRVQDYDEDYEVVVVDSGSTDGTLDVVREFAEDLSIEIRRISQEEFTYGRALNVGIEAASGDYVANLSAHSPPTSDRWLANLTEPLGREEVAAVYGKQVPREGVNPFEEMDLRSAFPDEERVFARSEQYTPDRPIEGFHFSNSNCALKREVWDERKFDEALPFAEDQLWGREVLAAGYEVVYRSDAGVYHTHPFDLETTYTRRMKGTLAEKVINDEPRDVSSSVYGISSLMYSIAFRAVVDIPGLSRWLIGRGDCRYLPWVVPYFVAREAGRSAGHLLYFAGRY